MTAAFSADPARKYRAAVSMEAWPRRAWAWAGSAPLWQLAHAEDVAAAVGAQAWDAGVGADGQHDLGDAGDDERAALPGPGGARAAAAFVQPGRDQVPGAFRVATRYV
jgi:hypothetical protein